MVTKFRAEQNVQLAWRVGVDGRLLRREGPRLGKKLVAFLRKSFMIVTVKWRHTVFSGQRCRQPGLHQQVCELERQGQLADETLSEAQVPLRVPEEGQWLPPRRLRPQLISKHANQSTIYYFRNLNKSLITAQLHFAELPFMVNILSVSTFVILSTFWARFAALSVLCWFICWFEEEKPRLFLSSRLFPTPNSHSLLFPLLLCKLVRLQYVKYWFNYSSYQMPLFITHSFHRTSFHPPFVHNGKQLNVSILTLITCWVKRQKKRILPPGAVLQCVKRCSSTDS